MKKDAVISVKMSDKTSMICLPIYGKYNDNLKTLQINK